MAMTNATRPHVILIDNYDSFAHNLARYARLAGLDITVIRNDALSVQDIIAHNPDGIIISPGPRAPNDAGICIDLLCALPDDVPVLGVCLGHQSIAQAFGGKTIQASAPMHGRASVITHDQSSPLLGAIPTTFDGARYHSLMVDINGADDLHAIAHSDDTIMAIAHKSRPIYGIQFHPESLLTPHGQEIINSFSDIVIRFKDD